MSSQKVNLGEVVEDLTEERRITISDDEDILEPTITSKTHTTSVRKSCKGSDLKIKKRILIKEGDLVFSKLHTQNGAFAFADHEYKSTTTFLPLKILESKILKEFLFNQLHLLVPKLQTSDTVGRETYKTKNILDIEILLPSLSKQKEILKKIKSVEIEIKQLAVKPKKDQFSLERLRQAILSEAVQGGLVPQDPKDEPAEIFLKKIKAEKEKLIKEKKIKKEKLLPEITKEEIPYVLPEGWAWCRAGDLSQIGTGATPNTKNEEYWGGDINWITSASTGKNFITSPDKKITSTAIKETNCKVYPSGTLIMAMYGQGKTRGQISELKIDSSTNQACAAFMLEGSSKELKEYLKLFYKKFYREIRLLAEGGAQPNLNLLKIKKTLIPLPPLAEQKRIVEKVGKLMKLCDELEKKISKNKVHSENLMDAVLREVFENEK